MIADYQFLAATIFSIALSVPFVVKPDASNRCRLRLNGVRARYHPRAFLRGKIWVRIRLDIECFDTCCRKYSLFKAEI